MDVTLSGSRPRQPAVAVLGTWDPFSSAHDAFVGELRAHAHANGLAPVVVMLDPPPPVFLAGPQSVPIYHDFGTRVALLHAAGIETLVCIAFSGDDLGRSTAEFFETICPHVDLAEFWLKKDQTIGSGGKGNGLAVLIECKKRGIRLRVAPPHTREIAGPVKQRLQLGMVRSAIEAVGRPPTVRRPASGVARLAWAQGRYHAVAAIGSACPASSPRFALDLIVADDGMGELHWPDPAVETLAFLDGPGDAGNATH